MSTKLKKYISSDPKILGGTPVISGTRIPIERVFQLIKQGYSVDDLKKEYSWIDKKKIQYTVAYLVKAGIDAFQETKKIQVAS